MLDGPGPPPGGFIPAQYPPPGVEFAKSREGNFNRTAGNGGGGSNWPGVVARAERMLGKAP